MREAEKEKGRERKGKNERWGSARANEGKVKKSINFKKF
jgi:hypothetical protein